MFVFNAGRVEHCVPSSTRVESCGLTSRTIVSSCSSVYSICTSTYFVLWYCSAVYGEYVSTAGILGHATYTLVVRVSLELERDIESEA